MVPAVRFLIRDARPADLADVFRLARHLDSYNLPADRGRLRGLLRASSLSFSGGRPPGGRRFLFVLEDLSSGRVVGCSLIVAKHGTPSLPHLFLDSFVERRFSRTLKRTVEHRCLRLGADFNGPTEVGGLVLLPAYRRRPEKLGRWLSYVRFLYIAAHRERFQKRILVEFLPAFLKNGRSPFWDYFGEKFTGLSYHQADRLSIDNKEFILSLFPPGVLYQDFFPEDIVRHLGRVGAPALPAAKLLRRIGFRYLDQVEPFDGGPYYGAATGDVTLVRRARARRTRTVEAGGKGGRFLLMCENGGHLCALAAPGPAAGAFPLSPENARLLGVEGEGRLWTAPFP